MDESTWWKISLCCVGAGAVYLLGESYHNKAVALRSTPRIAQFKDLSRIVGAASNIIVTLCGKVGTNDSPIECKSSNLKCVIWEERTYNHYQNLIPKENSSSHDNDSTLKKEKVWENEYIRSGKKRRSVPWYLDDGTGLHVRVEGPLDTNLSFVSRFYESAMCHVCGSCLQCGGPPHCCQKRKFVGVKKEEWVLPVGKSLTVVGEVTQDGSGSIQIERPKKGLFIVSSKSIDEVIEESEKIARFLKGGSMILLGVGVFLIV